MSRSLSVCTVYTPCRNCFVFLCLAALDSKAPKAEDIEEEDDDVPGRMPLKVVTTPLWGNPSTNSMTRLLCHVALTN